MKEINLTEWIIYTEIFSEKKSCSGLPIPSGLNPISTRVALIIATQARIYFLQTSKQQYGSKTLKAKKTERKRTLVGCHKLENFLVINDHTRNCAPGSSRGVIGRRRRKRKNSNGLFNLIAISPRGFYELQVVRNYEHHFNI